MSYEDNTSVFEEDEMIGGEFGFGASEDDDLFEEDAEEDEIPEGFHEDLGPSTEEES